MSINKIVCGQSKVGEMIETINVLVDNSFANTNDSAAATAEELRVEINADEFNQICYGTFELINSVPSSKGVFNFANFAGQGTATDKIGFIFHHYTDSPMAQLDNVGTGDILRLKNAKNTNRRADEGANYAGSGDFLVCYNTNGVTDAREDIFKLQYDGTFLFPGAAGTAAFVQNKSDDGFYAYSYNAAIGKEHRYFARFVNGAKEFLGIENDVSLTRASVISHATQTSGMMLQSKAGAILLNPATTLDINKPFKPQANTTLPAVINGAIIMYNGVPVYGSGGQWLYFSDNSVAV